jgi:hypothetical protein
MLLTPVPELHKKWQHVPLEPAARSANGADGKSQVAVAIEPPVLHEFEPDHLVAEPE